MDLRKKSFLLYFDSYPVLLELPPEQRGWLITVLYLYAEQVWRDETVTLEEIMEQFPRLTPQTRIACEFMGANILRDSQRWLSQRQARQARRQAGAAAQAQGAEERQARTRQEMELARRMLEGTRK